MMSVFGKISKILATILSALLQIANLFLGNIVVYEATNGIKFNWMLLLKSKLFWIVLIITILYYLIAHIVNQESNKTDDAVERAIKNSEIKLLDIVTKNAKSGNFESSERAMKILDKLRGRRK